ncbi:MAG: hypothetical protein DHS20C10_07140 [marine bacterium B5-7]|nr:MAG: hypothetical protein DHS20C10_07140 [marine bacterium B5-7]
MPIKTLSDPISYATDACQQIVELMLRAIDDATPNPVTLAQKQVARLLKIVTQTNPNTKKALEAHLEKTAKNAQTLRDVLLELFEYIDQGDEQADRIKKYLHEFQAHTADAIITTLEKLQAEAPPKLAAAQKQWLQENARLETARDFPEWAMRLKRYPDSDRQTKGDWSRTSRDFEFCIDNVAFIVPSTFLEYHHRLNWLPPRAFIKAVLNANKIHYRMNQWGGYGGTQFDVRVPHALFELILGNGSQNSLSEDYSTARDAKGIRYKYVSYLLEIVDTETEESVLVDALGWSENLTKAKAVVAAFGQSPDFTETQMKEFWHRLESMSLDLNSDKGTHTAHFESLMLPTVSQARALEAHTADNKRLLQEKLGATTVTDKHPQALPQEYAGYIPPKEGTMSHYHLSFHNLSNYAVQIPRGFIDNTTQTFADYNNQRDIYSHTRNGEDAHHVTLFEKAIDGWVKNTRSNRAYVRRKLEFDLGCDAEVMDTTLARRGHLDIQFSCMKDLERALTTLLDMIKFHPYAIARRGKRLIIFDDQLPYALFRTLPAMQSTDVPSVTAESRPTLLDFLRQQIPHELNDCIHLSEVQRDSVSLQFTVPNTLTDEIQSSLVLQLAQGFIKKLTAVFHNWSIRCTIQEIGKTCSLSIPIETTLSSEKVLRTEDMLHRINNIMAYLREDLFTLTKAIETELMATAEAAPNAEAAFSKEHHTTLVCYNAETTLATSEGREQVRINEGLQSQLLRSVLADDQVLFQRLHKHLKVQLSPEQLATLAKAIIENKQLKQLNTFAELLTDDTQYTGLLTLFKWAKENLFSDAAQPLQKASMFSFFYSLLERSSPTQSPSMVQARETFWQLLFAMAKQELNVVKTMMAWLYYNNPRICSVSDQELYMSRAEQMRMLLASRAVSLREGCVDNKGKRFLNALRLFVEDMYSEKNYYSYRGVTKKPDQHILRENPGRLVERLVHPDVLTAGDQTFLLDALVTLAAQQLIADEDHDSENSRRNRYAMRRPSGELQGQSHKFNFELLNKCIKLLPGAHISNDALEKFHSLTSDHVICLYIKTREFIDKEDWQPEPSNDKHQQLKQRWLDFVKQYNLQDKWCDLIAPLHQSLSAESTERRGPELKPRQQ